MKKKLALLSLVAICLCFFTACKAKPLPNGMDDEAVLTAAREVVTLLQQEQWQQVYDLMREDGQEKSSLQQLEEYMQNIVQKYGQYQKETDSMLTAQTLEDGEDYATAVLYCKHEKKRMVYRIAFSTDMQLMGFEITKQGF